MKGAQDVVKPSVVITESMGNIYALIGGVVLALEEEGLEAQALEFVDRAVLVETYSAVLDVSRDYIQFHHGGSNEPEAN